MEITMTTGQLAQRVDSLEDYMKDLSYQALKTERELARLSLEMREFKDEMRGFKDEMGEFKDEMLGFKDEMSDFKDEMRGFKDEMSDFKDEMRGFKDEMIEFKDEMRGFKDEILDFKEEAQRDRRQMNRKWGELAYKMGTLVEDLVAPSLPRVAKELFGCKEPEIFTVRMRRRKGPDTMEIDCLLVCGDTVLINETKSNLRISDVDELMVKLKEFTQFFPEYGNRKIAGIIASLYVDQNIVQYASRQNILVMGMGDETMQILNPEII
jgi:hypothetical protein